MGTIRADLVLERASGLLMDKTKRRWPDHELLQWANDGQLAIVDLRPDAYTARRSVKLAAGTRQSLSAGDLRLLDLPRNLGLDGNSPGQACRFIARDQLDLSDPSWHTAPASAVVLHWMYSPKIPKVFWVYPQQPSTDQGYVEMDVSTPAPPLTINGLDGANATSVLALDDVWINALAQFTVYRAFSKDAEYTQVGGKADLAYREFVQLVGATAKVGA